MNDKPAREIPLGPASGLRLSRADADRAERLQRSREWLVDYHEQRRQRANQATTETAE